MKFIILPLWPCLLIPAATIVGAHYMEGIAPLLHFAGFMLSVPAYWLLGVRLIDFFTSGVSKADNCYTLRYSAWYHLHTVMFSRDKVVLVNIRQSIFQRRDHKCDLVVSTRAEGKFTHHIRNLNWDACAELFDAQDLP